MKKKNVIIFIILILASFVLTFFVASPAGERESIQTVMRDAVLHETNQISLFGIITVNPALVSAVLVSSFLLVVAVLLRIFFIPKMQIVPGKLQTILESVVEYFENLAKANSPHCFHVLGAYTFGAGVYICLSTLFELFGFQAITTKGTALALPAPLSDVNAGIAMGVFTYLFIMWGGITSNGFKGFTHTLKEFSLPISMSFRLFGALLSGLLVNELVYYFIHLSYVLPVVVAVLFTLLHAVIQAYVLTMLAALFFGEVTAPIPPKTKKMKQNRTA